MSPFVYLQLLRVKNAVRRSFKTPVRGFMTVLLIGYGLFSLLLLFTLKETKLSESVVPVDMQFPVGFITLTHLLLLLYTIPPPKYLYSFFSETDIANLYQAPMPRWRVFRFFFFTRTFFGYCILYAIFAFYGYWGLRMGIRGVFAHATDANHWVWNILHVATVLSALAGLLLWRIIIDLRREFRLIPAIAFRIFVVAFLGTVATVTGNSLAQAYGHGTGFQAGIVNATSTFPLTVLLAPFKVLAQLFLVYPEPFSAPFWMSIAFWAVLALSGYVVLRSHAALLYEYSSRLSEFRTQIATRMRSPAERLKEMKKSGKKVLRLPWFVRMFNPRKAGAVLWLDMVVTWRSFGTVIRTLQAICFFLVVAGWAALRIYSVPIKQPDVWRISGLVMFLASWPLSIVSTLGFTEALRRVEIQKPLPLSALHTVTMHILQWTMMTCSVTLVPFLSAFILLGSDGYPVLFVLVAGWSFMHCMISGFFLISLYNPDASDPLQRMHAMFFGFLISTGASVPAAVVLVVSVLLHAPFLLVLGLLVPANIASAGALHYLSARKYANFVPTE